MSKIALPALYQADTFGSSFGHRNTRPETITGTTAEMDAPASSPRRASGFTPARSSTFLVQMIVATGTDLRKALGRRDIAEQREAAYGTTEANRPSRNPGRARLVALSA